MTSNVRVICPCGRHHRTAMFVTEVYRHRFRCGLTVKADRGVTDYKYKGKPIQVQGLATDQSETMFVNLLQAQ